MKTLAFVMIAITIGFISRSFAQNCGLVEADADVVGSHTWNTLIGHMLDNPHDPYHWKNKKAEYYINTLSSSVPPNAATAIKAADASWDAASWNGANNFTFVYKNSTGLFAGNDDGKNVVSFQAIPTQAAPPPIATTVYNSWELNILEPFEERDRLKDVDTFINTYYYWATGAHTTNQYDIQSVMAHEFGHWLVLEHLYHGSQPGASGCDEYLATVMYYSIDPAAIKHDLHWIDKWGKWYIYSSGQVNMAPAAMPAERIPPPLQSAAGVLQTRLLQNYPGPFNPETWIPYELANDANVSIDIYDLGGGLVRTIAVGDKPRGSYVERPKAVYWNGKDDTGQSVASGVYFYTLRTDDFSQTRRLVILK